MLEKILLQLRLIRRFLIVTHNERLYSLLISSRFTRKSLYVLRQRLFFHLGHKISQSYFFSLLFRFRRSKHGVVISSSAGELEVDLNGVVGQHCFIYGAFEPEEISFLKRKLLSDPNPIFVDIGANIGTHSLSLAREIPSLRAFCFEANPFVFERLQRNVTRNSLEQRIQISPLALSGAAGLVDLSISPDDALSGINLNPEEKTLNTVQVERITFSEFAREKELEKVSVIKIDVEGHEHEVLLGSQEYLRVHKPDIFIELTLRNQKIDRLKETERLLESLGYHSFNFQRGELISPWEFGVEHINFLFTTTPPRG